MHIHVGKHTEMIHTQRHNNIAKAIHHWKPFFRMTLVLRDKEGENTNKPPVAI